MSGHYGGNPYAWQGGTNNPHIARYFLARGWVMPGETVLDAACCTGYGSHLLGQVAKKVIGIDVDQGAIEEANSRWKAPNIDFRVADLNEVEWPDVDVLVSIESFEHFNDFRRCLAQARKHVRRAMIITVPLGGTSHTYAKDQLHLPASENNDFNNLAHMEKIFTTRDWKCHTIFQFGYSAFGVFYRKAPAVPPGYDKKGYPKEYIAP